MTNLTRRQLKWFVLFMLDPQAEHGLNNALLRTLLLMHKIPAADAEKHAHIHINNLVWGAPTQEDAVDGASSTESGLNPNGENITPPKLAGSTESGQAIIADDNHIYVETEKQLLSISTELIQPQPRPFAEFFSPALAHVGTRQGGKTPLMFYLGESGDTSEHAEAEIMHVTPAELKQGLAELLAECEGQVNMPGNNQDNPCLQLFYALLDGADISAGLAELYKKHGGGYAADNDEDRASPATANSAPKIAEEADANKEQAELSGATDANAAAPGTINQYVLAQERIRQLQDLRDWQQEILNAQGITNHCWLWYPLKFRRRHHPGGLPFVVYEIETEQAGKLTFDLHYEPAAQTAAAHSNPASKPNNSSNAANTDSAGANLGGYWRLDVFRRPGRAGPDLADLLKSKNLTPIDIDHQQHYVPKYVLLKYAEPPAPPPPTHHIRIGALVNEQISKLVAL